MDKCMKPLIKLLNKKGYDTKFCCSGHPMAEIHQQPDTSQEIYLCVKYQLNKEIVMPYNVIGYFWFKREKDRDVIFSELKKTKYSKRFINYNDFGKRDKIPAKERKWLEKNDKTWIEFKTDGLTQKGVDNFWINFAKKMNRVL